LRCGKAYRITLAYGAFIRVGLHLENLIINFNHRKKVLFMYHEKMKYTYVGIDSHKDTHTAVFLDCFFDRLGEIVFENRPSAFDGFLELAHKYRVEGTSFLFGLEDTANYGRTLTVFLKNCNHTVKHVNALLVAKERKNGSVTQKTDSIDAECAARVLLSKYDSLPDASAQDNYWVLRTLVLRRGAIVKNNKALKNQLHNLLTQHYPVYRTYFENIDCSTSLAFFLKYPSPERLKNIDISELTALLRAHSHKTIGEPKARQILESIEDTAVHLQDVRDMAVQSTIRQLQFNLTELKQMDETLTQVLDGLGTTLTGMKGIDTVSASQLLSCIGDIRRFASPAKLARYAGIAPVTYASGKNDKQYANQRGNRELNSLFFNLALRVSMTAGPKKRIVNPFFHEYYHRKISEGKTKRQALKCVQRRLVNIVWNMLMYGRDYINPESL
jgi:transposase